MSYEGTKYGTMTKAENLFCLLEKVLVHLGLVSLTWTEPKSANRGWSCFTCSSVKPYLNQLEIERSGCWFPAGSVGTCSIPWPWTYI